METRCASPPGKTVRLPVEKVTKTQQVDNRVKILLAIATARPSAIRQITADAHMGKQTRLLENDSNTPPSGGNIDRLFGIEQDAVRKPDRTGVWPDQAGNCCNNRGLACPGPTEQGRDTTACAEAGVKIEPSCTAADCNIKHDCFLAR